MSTVARQGMQFVWIASFYDVPLNGLCMKDGELMLFRESAEEDQYHVIALSPCRKARWLLRKRLFELCVGEHWSYPQRANGVRFHWRKPVWLHKALFWGYYKLQPLLKESA
jgi:hypothetical protein